MRNVHSLVLPNFVRIWVCFQFPNPLKKKVSNHLFIGIHHILTVLPKSVGIAGTKKASDNLAGNPRIKRIKICLSFSRPRLVSSAGKMNDF